MSFILFAQLNLGKAGATEYVTIPSTGAYSLGTVTVAGQEDATIAIESSSSARVIVAGDEAIALALETLSEGNVVEGIQGHEAVAVVVGTESQGTVWPWITGTEAIFLPPTMSESDGRPSISAHEAASCAVVSLSQAHTSIGGDESVAVVVSIYEYRAVNGSVDAASYRISSVGCNVVSLDTGTVDASCARICSVHAAIEAIETGTIDCTVERIASVGIDVEEAA